MDSEIINVVVSNDDLSKITKKQQQAIIKELKKLKTLNYVVNNYIKTNQEIIVEYENDDETVKLVYAQQLVLDVIAHHLKV